MPKYACFMNYCCTQTYTKMKSTQHVIKRSFYDVSRNKFSSIELNKKTRQSKILRKLIIPRIPQMKALYSQGLSFSKFKGAVTIWWKVSEPLSSVYNSISKIGLFRSNAKIPPESTSTPSSSQSITNDSFEQKLSSNNESKGKEMPKTETINETLANVSSEIAESVMTKMFHQSNAAHNMPQRLVRPETYSKISISNRAHFLVKSVRSAKSNMSVLVRLEEMSKHLYQFPESRNTFIKERTIPHLCNLRDYSKDSMIQSQSREILALLGHIDPIQSQGVRILSIDGGGTRGLMALEILKSLESLSGRPVYKLFDYICGVSTGAVLAVLLGALKLPVDKCKELYLRISKDVFKQSTLWGTGQLVLNHSYYNTDIWEKVLKDTVGGGVMIESTRNADCPKVAAVSTVVNQTLLQAYVFRNYVLPPRVQSHYSGSATHQMWEALRASAAAPGYFEEFKLDGLVHQDGGILMNNPSALALHECKHLWPDEHIQCVVSLGNGRYIPTESSSPNLSSLKTKISKIVDSATDTEGVHIILHDLMPPNSYFRFNPYLTEQLSLDENREEKMSQLENDAQMYVRRNDAKMSSAVKRLVQDRTPVQRSTDWINRKLRRLKIS